MEFLVGSFNHPSLYLLQFYPPSSSTPGEPATLKVVAEHPAIGNASWLALSPDHKYLYTTAWTTQPTIAAYAIRAHGRNIQFLNAKRVHATSGYVCANATHVFSCGGPSGEVFTREADGSLGSLVQELDFVSGQGENQSEKRGVVAHGNFGGLRHGAHSFDLSPDGRSAYVADIGRNCIWIYNVVHSRRAILEPPLVLREKKVAPREGDGPRHTWPHPNGNVLYSLQEHSSMVDVYAIHRSNDSKDSVLEHKQGVKIIPAERDCKMYWADEVRLSTGPNANAPRHLFASTRGLATETLGYVAAFKLREDGMLDDEAALVIWETPTSGGLANAFELAPWRESHGGFEYFALTDSQEGWVFILSFDGAQIREVARVELGKTEDGKTVGAATAVWLE